MILLIPAFEPGPHLVPLIASARDRDEDLEVLVVDDGSGARFRPIFDDARSAGAHVLHHDVNRGKGAALKSGFVEISTRWPGEDVVTADSDGQHTVTDILRVADALRRDAAEGRSRLVLGCRDFGGRVPLRSRFGNSVSRALFHVAAGWRASDTQTGLRGFPASMLAWLSTVPGERFEYETEMLLRLRGGGFEAAEVPIETVYLEGNASSHFRPILDSLRVTLPLVTFTASSLAAFLIDTAAVLLLSALLSPWLPHWLVVSIVAARVASASVNFAVNRRLVFRQRGRAGVVRHAARYGLLAVALLASNIVWMRALTDLGIPLLVAKVATECVLFITSYQVQRRFVFSARSRAEAGPTSVPILSLPPQTPRTRIAAP